MLNLGVVVIGRNEGDNLKQCFEAIKKNDSDVCVVYVDSGSTDNSLQLASKFGVAAIQLDAAQPFTAGRARNTGFSWLKETFPEIDLVQFVDGDCELFADWLNVARQALHENEGTAIVCGRRRERFPSRSVYNNLCEIEWNTPLGFASACGGDFMCRTEAFELAGGFSDTLIAGEEPELCYRLRQQGWTILRIDSDMTLHDVNISTFSQWAQRAERAGHAYAGGVDLHGCSGQRFYVKEVASIIFWGVLLPCLIITSAIVFSSVYFVFLLSYVFKIIQIFLRHRLTLGGLVSLQYSLSVMMAKFFQAKGICIFYLNKALGLQRQLLIEYK
jgi:GT2 family glycosyltransferase